MQYSVQQTPVQSNRASESSNCLTTLSHVDQTFRIYVCIHIYNSLQTVDFARIANNLPKPEILYFG